MARGAAGNIIDCAILSGRPARRTSFATNGKNGGRGVLILARNARRRRSGLLSRNFADRPETALSAHFTAITIGK
jgi:hypothetical protein